MLILTRKEGEKIRIGDDIQITVVEIKKGTVKIGISAPKGLAIHREEIYQRILEENKAASTVELTGSIELDDIKIRDLSKK